MAGDSLSVYAYYGNDRFRERKALLEHDIVLTTYGVLASESNQPVSTKSSYACSLLLIIQDICVHLIQALFASADGLLYLSYVLGTMVLSLWGL